MPTLDTMSNADDAASRLSSALDEVFSGGNRRAEVDRPDEEGEFDGDGEPLALPEIVPATADPPPTEELPTLPRAIAVTRVSSPTPAPPAAAPTRTAAPTAAPPAAVPTPTATRPTTGWADHMGAAPASAPSASLRSPGRRPRVRRVTRVVRHIDPWSTFKVALLFSAVGYVVMLTSGVLLWRVAESTGTLDNVERWFTQFGWETFELKGGEVFHSAWIIGLFGAVALTGGLVLLATLFNLVSDIVGGVRVTVLEEEVVERTVSSTRRYVVRRPPLVGDRSGPGAVADWNVDDDDEPSATPVAAPPTSDVSSPVPDWSVDDD